MAAILQFWMDKATFADGELFGGIICPASALTEYVMNALNPVLPAGHKVTWDHVITCTPWMKKRLFNLHIWGREEDAPAGHPGGRDHFGSGSGHGKVL